MRPRQGLLLLVAFVATVLFASWAARLLGFGLTGSLGLHLGPGSGQRLDDKLVELITGQDQALNAMVFLTAEDQQPPERRGMQASIAALLGALETAVPGQVSFGIADPTNDADMAAFAAKRGVASFVDVSNKGDRVDARELYASVLLDWGTHGTARLENLGPEDLPFLQALLRERLKEMLAPQDPRILLLGPATSKASDPYRELSEALTAIATVTRADPEATDFDPEALLQSELVFWLDPGPHAGDQLPAIERLIDSGRTLVLAGSPFDASMMSASGMRDVCAGLGVRLSDAPLEPQADEALVASIAPDQDFRQLVGQPNGTLRFQYPAALAFDPVVLARRVSSARRLATTSETEARAKQTLVALIDPLDDARGQVVVLGASTPLTQLTLAGTAHVPMVQALLDTYTQPDQRVRLAALPPPAPLVPAMNATERLAWRLFVLAPLPLAWLIARLWLGRRRSAQQPRITRTRVPFHRSPFSNTWRLPLIGFGVALLASWIPRGPALDLTREGLNQPAPELIEVLRAFGEQQTRTLHATLYASPAARLPSALASLPDELERLLRTTGALELDWQRVFPEALEPDERDVLTRAGIAPFPFQGPVGLNGSERRQAYLTLRLSLGPPAQAESGLSLVRDLAFESALEREEVEFRLALALESLNQGRRPAIGFASDLPRMSAAEDYEFQVNQSFAPREGDVFGRARRQLERAGFAVEHINPRQSTAPALPADLDALVWMQPRREMRPMLESFAAYMRGGGRALLAAQHMRTQARQYRGAGYETVYWPQPQLTDLDRWLLPEWGVTLEKRVRFDALQAELPIVQRLSGRTADTEFDSLMTRAPFLVRVPASQFADTVLMRGIASLDLADPSALHLDSEALTAAGLTATPLLHGSAQSWSLDWQGGWLPKDVLAGPETFDPAPLFGVQLTGHFPAPAASWDDGWPHAERFASPAAPGELLLLGNSAMWTDEILDVQPNGGALLLNAAAHLALERFGPRGTQIAGLATRRPIDRRLGLFAPSTQSRARWLVIAGGGLIVLLLAGLSRSRKPAGARAAFAPAAARRKRHRPRISRTAWAVALGVLALSAIGLATTAPPATGRLTFGRVFDAAVRDHKVSAVHLQQRATQREWLYGYQNETWRELLGIGALGDPQAITKLVEDCFAAEGTVWARATGAVPEYELTDNQGWRIELFSAGANPNTDAPFLQLDVGLVTDQGQGTLVRRPGQDAIWHIDRNPRYTLFGSLKERDLTAVPPLADRRLVPRSWPLPAQALQTLAWQRDGVKSLSVTKQAVPRTPDELQAGLSPFVFELVGDGVTERFAVPPPADLPQASAKPDPVGAALNRFQAFVASTEYVELLDPERADEWGLGPNGRPYAILLFAWAPTEALPEGLSMTLRIGPERNGSHAAIHTGTGNLIRLSVAQIELLLPMREDFRDPQAIQRWR